MYRCPPSFPIASSPFRWRTILAFVKHFYYPAPYDMLMKCIKVLLATMTDSHRLPFHSTQNAKRHCNVSNIEVQCRCAEKQTTRRICAHKTLTHGLRAHCAPFAYHSIRKSIRQATKKKSFLNFEQNRSFVRTSSIQTFAIYLHC